MTPFDRAGGLGRMFQLFGSQVDPLLAGLDEAVPPRLFNDKPDAVGRVSPRGGGSNSPGEGTWPTT